MQYRLYRITIQNPSLETIIIQPPFTCKIKVDRKKLSSTNKVNIEIYNLGKTTRSKLYKDKYNTVDYWQIIVEAGYGNSDFSEIKNQVNLPIIFKGNIYECNSQKDGVNWITYFDCFDGMYGVQNGFVSQSFNSGTTNKNMMQTLIGTMSKLTPGSMGSATDGQIDRGQVLFGQSATVLKEKTKGQAFIDNEQVHILDDNEVIGNDVILLDSSLLRKTPKRSETMLDVDCLFFPNVSLMQTIALKSQESIYDGQYAVHGISHDFTWSGAECGDAYTQLNLFCGAAGLRNVV